MQRGIRHANNFRLECGRKGRPQGVRKRGLQGDQGAVCVILCQCSKCRECECWRTERWESIGAYTCYISNEACCPNTNISLSTCSHHSHFIAHLAGFANDHHHLLKGFPMVYLCTSLG